MYKYAAVFTLLIIVAMTACDSGLDGQLNENIPPTTSLTVNEINLPEGERLVSQVNISWWGDDPDGYVVGFELYIGDPSNIGENDWTFTTSNDSTFILPIEEGSQDADVDFTVRAVDNEGARDPEPPTVTFPITNSPPVVQFNNFETPPDTTYRIASFGFTASDPDGEANLNRIEIALNDTTSEGAWKDIGLGLNLVTLRIDDTQENPTASVLLGRTARSSDITFDTVLPDGENEFFVRAVDNAAATSESISYEWYVKRQTSNVLFLNDFQGTNSEERFNLHANLLNEVGVTEIDYIDISDGAPTGGRRVAFTQALPDRSLASPTTNLMLAEWDHIYWISDNLDRNIGYALEMTLDFFEQGGTMFVNIPSKSISDQNALLQFVPFERVEPLPSGARRFEVPNGSNLIASSEIENAPENLTLSRTLITERPIVPFDETIPLFEAPFVIRDFDGVREHDGSKLISATNPEENLIYFGIDLDFFTEESDLARLIEIIVIDILEFQQ